MTKEREHGTLPELLLCPCCGEAAFRRRYQDRCLYLNQCLQCGHWLASHGPLSSTLEGTDYHAQYGDGSFRQSLLETRRRQGRLIVEQIIALYGLPQKLLDFGCGLGTFLSVAKEYGLGPLAGADTSNEAQRRLQAAGTEALAVEIRNGALRPLSDGLSFSPTCITFLDVIEHFPKDALEGWFRLIADGFGVSARLVVVKVPRAEGLFFRLAMMLARLGFKKPLHQLFQVGTWPPHEHYFTDKSLRCFIGRNGFQIDEMIYDPEIEAESLHERMHWNWAPKRLVQATARSLLLAIKGLRWQDSVIVFCTRK